MRWNAKTLWCDWTRLIQTGLAAFLYSPIVLKTGPDEFVRESVQHPSLLPFRAKAPRDETSHNARLRLHSPLLVEDARWEMAIGEGRVDHFRRCWLYRTLRLESLRVQVIRGQWPTSFLSSTLAMCGKVWRGKCLPDLFYYYLTWIMTCWF